MAVLFARPRTWLQSIPQAVTKASSHGLVNRTRAYAAKKDWSKVSMDGLGDAPEMRERCLRNLASRRWTRAEEQRLLILKTAGLSFRDVAERLEGRTSNSVNRRLVRITPVGDRRPRDKFTPEEDQKVLNFQAQRRKWAAMSKQFPGRSADSLKRRYHNYLKGGKKE